MDDYRDYEPALDALEKLATKNKGWRLGQLDACRDQLKRALDEQAIGTDQENKINRISYSLNSLSRELSGKNFDKFRGELPKRMRSLGDLSDFDLEEFEECTEVLDKTGLVGVSVTISKDSNRHFPTHLLKRLQATFEPFQNDAEIYIPPGVSLKVRFDSIDDIVEQLKPYKLRLAVSAILLTVTSDDEERLTLFWEKMSLVFDDPAKNWFLVLIIKEGEFQCPGTIEKKFSAPVFRRRDVLKWVRSIISGLPNTGSQKKKLLFDWTEAVMGGCSKNGQLHTDLVYEYLDMSLERLENKSTEALYAFFKEWNQIYAQTSS